jgi:hypothetical protein
LLLNLGRKLDSIDGRHANLIAMLRMLVMLCCLASCGRSNFELPSSSVDAEPKANGVDSRLVVDAADSASSSAYCAGWTHCDTFDGDFSIPTWQTGASGSGVIISVTSVKSKSGANSLRATRAPNLGRSESIHWGLIADIKECEVDVFVVDTFAAIDQALEVATFGLANSVQYSFPEPLQAIVTGEGLLARWEAHDNVNDNLVVGQSLPFALPATRNLWVHMSLALGINAGQATSATLAAATTSAPETSTLLLPSIPVSSQKFSLGIYETVGGGPALEVFFDNVRCR